MSTVSPEVVGKDWKLSCFNSVIRLTDRTFLTYNSASDRCLLETDTATPGSAEELSANRFDAYKAYGLVVESDKDEYREAFGRYKKTTEEEGTFILTVNPTLQCNFRCWYCYETHTGNTTMTEDVVESICKAIDRISDECDKLVLSFFGGEPMLEFDTVVRPLTEYAQKVLQSKGKAFSLIFTSNGYLINEEIADFISSHNCTSIQITLDGGPEHHNRTRVSPEGDSFEVITNAVKLLAERGINVLLRLNVTFENIESAFELPEIISSFSLKAKQHIEVACQQVWQDIVNGSLNEKSIELRRKFSEIGIHHSSKNRNSIDRCCYGDKHSSAVINHNGDVYKCTAVDFASCKAEGRLDERGEIVYGKDPYEEMLRKRQSKNICRNCRIMPLCNGGCYDKIMRYGTDHCLYPTEEAKDSLVMENIEESLYEAHIQNKL